MDFRVDWKTIFRKEQAIDEWKNCSSLRVCALSSSYEEKFTWKSSDVALSFSGRMLWARTNGGLTLRAIELPSLQTIYTQTLETLRFLRFFGMVGNMLLYCVGDPTVDFHGLTGQWILRDPYKETPVWTAQMGAFNFQHSAEISLGNRFFYGNGTKLQEVIVNEEDGSIRTDTLFDTETPGHNWSYAYLQQEDNQLLAVSTLSFVQTFYLFDLSTRKLLWQAKDHPPSSCAPLYHSLIQTLFAERFIVFAYLYVELCLMDRVTGECVVRYSPNHFGNMKTMSWFESEKSVVISAQGRRILIFEVDFDLRTIRKQVTRLEGVSGDLSICVQPRGYQMVCSKNELILLHHWKEVTRGRLPYGLPDPACSMGVWDSDMRFYIAQSNDALHLVTPSRTKIPLLTRADTLDVCEIAFGEQGDLIIMNEGARKPRINPLKPVSLFN